MSKQQKENSPSLFGEELELFGEELELFGEEQLASAPQKKPRKSLNPYQVGKWTGKNKTSRERRNEGLWERLFPSPKK